MNANGGNNDSTSVTNLSITSGNNIEMSTEHASEANNPVTMDYVKNEPV
jgi:hypothetical protein